MSDKHSKTISVKELKEALKSRLDELGEKLDSQDRMHIAIRLKIGLVTVKRYMDKGRIEEVRNIELAEQILNEAEKYLKEKSDAVAI